METSQVFAVIAVVCVFPVLFGVSCLMTYLTDLASLRKENLELADQILKTEKQCEESDLELAELVEQRNKAMDDVEKLSATNLDLFSKLQTERYEADRRERDYLDLKQQYEQMKELRNAWERKFNEVKALAEEEHAKVNFLKLQIDAGIGREAKLTHELQQNREKYNEAHAQLCQADDREKEAVRIASRHEEERQQWAKALDAQQKLVDALRKDRLEIVAHVEKLEGERHSALERAEEYIQKANMALDARYGLLARIEELERNVNLADARGYDEGRQAMFELFESYLNHVKRDILGVIGSCDDLTTVGCG